MAEELPEGTVTVLFTDVVGSTDLTTSRGDEAAQEILRGQRDLTRRKVEEHSGHEVKGLGDGFMVAFASARRAVACAVGIQRALQEHNRDQPLDEQVHVRIGMNTGEVLREEADLFGETVNAAARIAAKAKGGQILISEATKGVLGRAKDVELVDRGRFRLKGFPERWRLFEVVWQEETAAAPTLVERTPFVGREAERAELRRLLDQVAKGHGALVMIGGEPGVGKTRIAEELMAEARQRNMTALIGHCYEMEGAPPYVPYVEILEAAARLFPPEALREALGESAPEVAKLMPELRRLFPDIPPSPELPPEQERRYLFNGIRDFVARTGRDQPAVYVLDDLHWATDASLLLLQHIAQQLNEMPVLIVGTYRDVELDLPAGRHGVARPLASTLRELTRQRLAHDLILKRLPEDGVAAMLRALSGQDPPKALADVVYSETEGNPFFVEEVFSHFAEEGELFDAQGRWRTDLVVSDLDVPRGVRLVIGQRLERLNEESQRVLTSAAVIGRSFTFELLEALLDVDPDALLDAVDEAERANLIAAAEDGTPDGQAEARFTFTHELIRQTLVSGLSLPRRQRMHLRVAEAIEAAYARAPEEHAADLAHHLYQAGSAADTEKTVRYLTLAGEQALGAAAFEDALRHFENALSLQPPDDRGARAYLLHKRGVALRSLGRWDEALAEWGEALAIFEDLGDAEAVCRVCREMAYQLAWAQRLSEAVEVGRRGLAAVSQQTGAERCRLLGQTGRWLALLGDYDNAARMVVQAPAMAEELGDARLLAQVLVDKTAVHTWYCQLAEALDSGLRAVGPLRSTGDLWLLADALWNTQWALILLGRFDEAAQMGEEAEPITTRVGHWGGLMVVRMLQAWRDIAVTGVLARFEEITRANLELSRSTGLGWVSNRLSELGLCYFWRGRWEEALESFQEAARLELPDVFAGTDWGYLFLWKAHAGDRDEALAMLSEKRSDFPRSGEANGLGAWIMLLAMVEGLTILGERQKAARLYPLLLEGIDTGALVRPLDLRLVQTVAGMAAAAGGQWDRAEEHYREALRLAHELPVVIAQPEVRRWYARMLIDRAQTGARPGDAPGDRDKARQLLTEAIAMYRRIGMPKHIEMAEALLGET